MRLRSTSRGRARCAPHLGASYAALAVLFPSFTQAVNFQPVPSANLDFGSLGRIGIAGDFSGISLYEYEGQNGRSSSTNGSESVLAMLPNGGFTSLASTDASIRAMCSFMLANGDMQGVILAGNFTSVDGTESTAVALLNPTTGEVTPLAGLEGEVNAVLCDQDRDMVYVGGSFKGVNSTNALTWYGTEGWTNLPFAGFNGPVEAITKASNGHIIFGGRFTGLGNSTAPIEPDQQIINLAAANVRGVNSASDGSVSDPKNIVCSRSKPDTQGTWLVQDDTPGIWDAEFGYIFEPTKLRLWNTRVDGRGTKTFRYVALPDGGIMNFTYVDPETRQNRSCTSDCPLSNDPDIEFQDFTFVNKVGMSRFQLNLLDWFGAGAGLGGIELFHDDNFAYAVSDFNEPGCRSIEFPSNSTATGPWKESPSLQSSSDYLTAEVASDIDPESVSVVFTPNIRESGNYSVNMYTPGCQPDGTCEQRGRVNVTGTMSSDDGTADFGLTLFQSNNFDKFDQIYFGYIEKTSDSFKPTITLTPLPDENGDGQTVVAMRLSFILTNTTGGLNGLYDFDPDEATTSTTNLEDSAINKLGASFDQNTGVNSLVTSGDITFIGGNFTSEDHENIVAVNGDNRAQALDGGLDGPVLDMYLSGKRLYVGGEFAKTLTGEGSNLNHAAFYDVDANTWNPLGAGVDGRVDHVVPLRLNISAGEPETAIALSGNFKQINGFGDFDAISVDGFAIWLPSEKNWLQNLDRMIPTYAGLLTAAVLDIPDSEPVYAGSISSAQIGANGAVTLNDEGLGKFTVSFREASSSSETERRDLVTSEDLSGVVTGLFYEKDGRNLTVFGGHFSVRATNGDPINNLIIVDGQNKDAVFGPNSDISSDSVFVAVSIVGNTLYAGGRVTGTIDGTEVSGLIAYDLEKESFGRQPASISGGNGTVAVLSVRPDTSELYVGGNFTTTGGLDCPGLCLYNVDTAQWLRLGGDASGSVNSLLWETKDRLVVGGNVLTRGEDARNIAIYDAKKESWEDYPGADKIPGPVQVITPASSDNDELWVSGRSSEDDSLFIMKYNGDDWLAVDQSLADDSEVHSLQVFTVTEGHDDSDLLDSRQVLMITGSIGLSDFGMASAAIFNGTNFRPYAITSQSSSGTGSISQFWTQKDNFFSVGRSGMALVFVVLIGLAIALGLILLLVAAGILLDRIRKRREGYMPAPTSMYDRGSGMQRIPPQELLESLGRGRSGAPRV